ncbi:DUF2157 domain-containing protein [Paenibacillus nasutitermitis]|uniref:DUF2157 domain-containing protein n=1 Tax=Paenibacillus nasutitermitis TaxID=1652958 RepID=A0A916Z4T3_9BACL|nr:DUF2157 domain-containing protein [Paenibacillus nasutitermitis]GGD74492.1 hypothetical protein GCM10010911_35500 [Paenibacillus nasutitermitis]
MSRRWLEQEGPDWTNKGIITEEQYKRILSLYPERKRAAGLVPILGSVLVGLGILSFVAANWQDIPQLARLMLMIVVMCSLYASGWRFYNKEHDKLGISLISLGLVSFGASIVLTGQMFHLVAYNAASFVVWSAAGLSLTFLFRSRYLYILSLLGCTLTQWYSVIQFNSFSYAAFVLAVAGFGFYWWKQKDELLGWCLSASFLLQALLGFIVLEWPFSWYLIPVWLLYSAADLFKDRKTFYPFQAGALIAAFIFNWFLVLFWGSGNSSWRAEMTAPLLPYLIALVILLCFSLAGKRRHNRLSSGLDWILAIPFFYLLDGSDLPTLLLLFLFSLHLLWRGYMEEWRLKINLATLLFLVSTMTAYGKLAWDFMDKSLFFILGGILLLGLSWFLNRRKQQVLLDGREDKHHEDE